MIVVLLYAVVQLAADIVLVAALLGALYKSCPEVLI
jgi:hypothetical protein